VGSREYWDEKTRIQYINLKNAILKYEKKTSASLTFGNITEEIYWDFFKVINELYKEETGNYYIKTSIAKACKNLRSIFNSANEKNIHISLNYSKRGLKIHPSKAKYKTYLTENQLKKIIETDASHSNEFTTARNYIIIASFTGLRISDMKFLSEVMPEKRLINNNHYNCFFTKIRKSSENKEELIVGIPILGPVKKLLEENKGKFPKFPSEPNIRKCCKKFMKFMGFNDEVKVTYDYYLSEKPVLKTKKQYEIFSPHDCRSTFITNLQKMEIQNATIEPITHPKISYATILDLYNKSNLEDNILKLINALDPKKSELYKY
jgi:integrase